MFEGFNSFTIQYFTELERNNSKIFFRENMDLFNEGIKEPLEQLYYELSNFIMSYDPDLTTEKRRCISSPYNDARFCTGKPIKEYFYIRFRISQSLQNKNNILGLFFDASKSRYKYGINIYNLNTHGMSLVRNAILDDRNKAEKLIRRTNKIEGMQVYGTEYLKDHYLEESDVLKTWLNKKNICFMHCADINNIFFDRQLYNIIVNDFIKLKGVYFFLKKALS